MKKILEKFKKKNYFLFLKLSVLCLVITFLVHDILRSILLVPFFYLVTVFSHFFQAFSQLTFWYISIFIALFFTPRYSHENYLMTPKRDKKSVIFKSTSPLESFANMVSFNEMSYYNASQLSRYLVDLYFKKMMSNYENSLDIRDIYYQQKSEFPNDVKTIFEFGLEIDSLKLETHKFFKFFTRKRPHFPSKEKFITTIGFLEQHFLIENNKD